MTYIPTDSAVGVGVESTFGTYATVNRFIEFTEEDFDIDKQVKQGAGLRVGARLNRSARRVVTSKDVKGSLSFEQMSKGSGLLWAAAFGSGTSTVVAGATYQQVFRFGDVPGSLSVQKTIPQDDNILKAFTFLGCMVNTWELACDNGDLLKAKMEFLGKSVGTEQAAEAVSYVATPTMYHFAQGTVALAGALTAPTNTVLASSATPAAANVRSFTVSGDNKLGTRRNFGSAGAISRPRTGNREAKGKMVIEFDSNFSDKYISDTSLSALLEFDTGVALSTGTEKLQIAIPEIKLNGEIPKASSDGEVITLDVDFDILDNLTAAYPLYLAMRTSDAAL